MNPDDLQTALLRMIRDRQATGADAPHHYTRSQELATALGLPRGDVEAQLRVLIAAGRLTIIGSPYLMGFNVRIADS
jgi:hypothetical protein